MGRADSLAITLLAAARVDSLEIECRGRCRYIYLVFN